MTIDDFKKAKIEAMKNHDKDTVTGLNTLINKLMLFNIEKRAKGEEMSEADYVQILKKTQKELVEEKEAFEKAGREDTVRSLENQIAAIEKYLPKMMSEEEIRAVIAALPDKSVPAVMKHFKTEYAGKCDMAEVNKVLRSL
ncbi:MAG: GatB/YqeY domain-containing protein [Eubacteriales bacterium]|nr:GatB/YqeY domain-containing protein [Christensenellaceae bacterium]MDD7054778.1 GatB/YqeY domain-containing protein [Clostridiales bacterium]MDY2751300.1 GatB/YqeY domain-containing protein [Eubacteriales bacterium]MCI7583447.1 GatB/YqeY domain-containing protein [Christensenellaceae bacterium]MCI7769831.1 GatB/YqeY domain-containing protein [Christensenellaceae bacterium]